MDEGEEGEESPTPQGQKGGGGEGGGKGKEPPEWDANGRCIGCTGNEYTGCCVKALHDWV